MYGSYTLTVCLFFQLKVNDDVKMTKAKGRCKENKHKNQPLSGLIRAAVPLSGLIRAAVPLSGLIRAAVRV